MSSGCPRASLHILVEGRNKLVTADSLRTHTSKDLAKMAKTKGVPGWHSMRKEQLVSALLKLAKEKTKSKATRSANGKVSSKANGRAKQNGKSNGSARAESKIAKKIRFDRSKQENLKNLALISQKNSAPPHDRVILVVRDSYWIQAYWEITKTTVERAKAALSDYWHSAKPVLRLLETKTDGLANSVENVVREIPIHGGVKNWFIDVSDPPKSYRVAIGYVATGDRFHMIAKSNEVTTPKPGNESIDENWTDIAGDYQKFYAMSGGYNAGTHSTELQSVFEEKLKRPMNAPAFVRLGSGMGGDSAEFPFKVDAQMIVFGSTDPCANVTLGGEPVRLLEDGTFCVRMGLPDRRQVLPVVASSRDGTEQRTTVLAVERNTKVMEPISRDIEEI